MRKTVSLISLGCFRNTYDSGVIIRRLIEEGYVFKEKAEKVDTLVINTCGFIKEAKEESLEWIKKAVSLKREGKVSKIVVVGCLVERYEEELRRFFPLVDEYRGVEEFPPRQLPLRIGLPRHIGFLKISEGCINNCSYCAIPLIKGPLVSKDLDSIVKEAKILESEGVKELNIIGQDVTSWGKDLYKEIDLTVLVKKILKETRRIRWIRIIYTHPRHFSRRLIDLIAKEERICKYIDLPIQHINNRILRVMNRCITKKEIISLIRRIRKKIREVALRTSVIVGFPGETEREFKELYNFIKEVRFERLGAFIYSREEKTKAYGLKPQIHHAVKRKRYKEIMELQREISYEYNKSFVGRRIEILTDQRDNGVVLGRSQFSAYDIDGLVYIKKKNTKVGNFYTLNIVDALEYDLVAK